MNLLLIGAGALGSRHLQSCLKFDVPLQIHVVDTSEDSIALAKHRAAEIDHCGSHNVQYHQSLSSVVETYFEYLVLATGASGRRRLLEDVLERFDVKFAILEKILFQDLASYDKARALITGNSVAAFVNCPRRAYPFYKRIKSAYFDTGAPTDLRYSGGEWVGLACNTIHFLDLMNFLTEEDLRRVDSDKLDDGYVQSKRQGYIEMTGRLEAEFSAGSRVSIESAKGSDAGSIMEIVVSDTRIEVDELKGTFRIFRNGQVIEDSSYDLVYQSDLTHKMLGQLRDMGTCDLPQFSTSVSLHRIFIQSLLRHYNRFLDVDVDSLPIT